MRLSESLVKALEEGKLSERDAWDALVARHLKPDLKMNRENSYVPAKDVLRNREISRQEDIAKSVGDEWCRANGRNDYWQERSGSGVRPVFHVGVRDNRDKEQYMAALQGIAGAMNKAGFKAEIKTGSLYVTLDGKLADAIRNRYEEYLDLLAQHGARGVFGDEEGDEPCGDNGCPGTIGRDGYCSECGRRARSAFPREGL